MLPAELEPPDHLLGPMLWDAQTYQPLGMVAGHSTSVSGLAFSPDSRRLATSGMDGYVRFWDVSPESRWGEELLRPTLALALAKGWANRIRFTPDGRRLVTAAGIGIGRIDVWDAPPSPDLGLWPADGLRGVINALEFSQDGRFLVEGISKFASNPKVDENRGEVVVRDAQSGAPVARLSGPNLGSVSAAALGPDSMQLYVAGGKIKFTDNQFKSSDGYLESYPAAMDKPHILARSDNDSLNFVIAPMAKRIVTSDTPGPNYIRVWDPLTGRLKHSYRLTSGPISSVSVRNGGKLLVTGDMNSELRLWNLDGVAPP